MKTTKQRCIILLCLLLAGSGARAQTFHNINDGGITITANGTYIITGNGSGTANRIAVSSGVTADITLNGVNIDSPDYVGGRAFDIGGSATVNLTLEGTNRLRSSVYYAGLYLPSDATLTINGTGSLQAGNGDYEPAIDGGTIIINGGTITAYGGEWGAGINGGNITINGGTVKVYGGYGSAGINGNITITGGTVTANGGEDGPEGITGGTLKITGGSINSNTNVQPTNGEGDYVYLNTLTVGSTPVADGTIITEGSINGIPCAQTADAAGGVYGINNVVTDGGGKVYFWLSASTGDETVELKANNVYYNKSYTRNANDNNNNHTLTAPAYGITLDKTGMHTFPDSIYGYGALTPLTVTVTNTGYQPTGALTVGLSGANGSNFTLSASAISNMAGGGDTTFTVAPNAGLAAGTYTATVTVSGGNGISGTFHVSFTVNKKDISVADAGLSFDLTKTPVEVTVPAGVAGLGEITVRYNGRTRIPDEPGTYEVTVDIAAGTNYAGATGIVVGTVTIPEPDYPPVAQREIILPSMPGFTTDPPAGSYSVSSGDDFVFTLTPSATQALLTPVIAIGRTAGDGDEGVEITPNGDGSYTVRIRQVRQPLTVTIDFTTAGATVDGSRVWSHAGTLHITATTAGEARIYSVSGTLAKAVAVAAGETQRIPLPAGVYIVVLDGKPYKVFVE
jgi:hypothetical protein